MTMIRLAFFGAVLLNIACSFQYKLAEEAPVLAEVLEVEAACKIDFDCKLINQDCCHTEEGLVAVNYSSHFRMQKAIDRSCETKKAENADLCKEKTRLLHPKYPGVKCVEGKCAIAKKEDTTESSKTICDSDAQCVVFDPDCCNTGENLTAINISYGGSARHTKIKDCHTQLKDNPRLCVGKRASRYPQAAKVACVEKTCKIQ